MTLRYDDSNIMQLARVITTENGLPQVMPRVSHYGGTLADKMGLVPMADYPDEIIDEADWKEVILHCREKQLFPEFHQHATWAPEGYRWSQNALRAFLNILNEHAIKVITIFAKCSFEPNTYR